jgi:hypothetical protein
MPEGSRVAVLEWLARATPRDAGLSTMMPPAVRHAGRGGTVVILARSAGKGARELPSAVRTVTAAGARALVVVARSETWDERRPAGPALGDGFGGRAATRAIARGEDLGACLEG